MGVFTMKKSKLFLFLAVICACLIVPINANAKGNKAFKNDSESVKTYATKTIKVNKGISVSKWSVSNKKIQIVKKSKKSIKIKGIDSGTAIIKAKVGGKTYKCKVKISATENYKAVKEAKNWLEMIPLSYKGLIKELEDKENEVHFSHSASVFGAKNCGADWNIQAVKRAELDSDSYSCSKENLIIMLIEDDYFTKEQAEYGSENCNVDFNINALKSAEYAIKYNYYSYLGIIDYLEHDEKFTHEQSVYGADNCKANFKLIAYMCLKEYMKDDDEVTKDDAYYYLTTEKFTEEEIQYALTKCGF